MDHSSTYSSFFTSVLNIAPRERCLVFMFVCIPVRFMLGLMFLLFKTRVELSYIATVWGAGWLLFMVYKKNWIERDDTPPWWRGMYRIWFRFTFSILVFTFGLNGIASDNDRAMSNTVLAVTIWIDLLIGTIDYVKY